MELGLFGSDVLLGASDGLHDDLLGAESEVCQFDEGEGFATDELGLEEDVFWLEITMRDAVVMQLLNSLTHLQDAFQTLLLAHLVVLT